MGGADGEIPAAGTGTESILSVSPTIRVPRRLATRVEVHRRRGCRQVQAPFPPGVWQMGPTGTPNLFKQALAELTLSQDIPSDRVVFRLEPFESGPAKEIVLAPAAGHKLEVEVANLPTTPVVCKTSSDANNLTHFAAFYQLLASPPATAPVPASVRANCPGCAHEGEIIYCPPVEYQP